MRLKITTPAASTTSANYLAYAASQTRLPSSSPALTLLTSRARSNFALKRHAEVEAKGIQVTVYHGNKVVIEGKVDNWDERRAVEKAAWSAPGVASVEDRLTIA